MVNGSVDRVDHIDRIDRVARGRYRENEATQRSESQALFDSVVKLSMELATAQGGHNLVASTPRSAMNEMVPPPPHY